MAYTYFIKKYPIIKFLKIFKYNLYTHLNNSYYIILTQVGQFCRLNSTNILIL